MKDTRVTIVVVERERFSFAERSLESIYEITSTPFKLIYVDSSSPPRVRRRLEALAAEKNFRLLRSEGSLTPNQSRNLGQSLVDTEYVAFVDNDLIVAPGWLEKLLECAESTRADVAGPLYLEGSLDDRIVHMAGGDGHFIETDGRRCFSGKHRFGRRRLSEVVDQLRREPVETMEFHCLLVRNGLFTELGPLDEQFMSICEQQDFCLAVRAAGGSVFLEPAARVTYPTSAPLAWIDLPFFFPRWSDARGETTVRRLVEKWKLSPDDPFVARMTGLSKRHRRRYIGLWLPSRGRVARTMSYPLVALADTVLTRRFSDGTGAPDSRPPQAELSI